MLLLVSLSTMPIKYGRWMVYVAEGGGGKDEVSWCWRNNNIDYWIYLILSTSSFHNKCTLRFFPIFPKKLLRFFLILYFSYIFLTLFLTFSFITNQLSVWIIDGICTFSLRSWLHFRNNKLECERNYTIIGWRINAWNFHFDDVDDWTMVIPQW